MPGLPPTCVNPLIPQVRGLHCLEAMKQKTAKKAPSKRPFLSDLQSIRKRARDHIRRGAITPAYRGDRELSIGLLNEALATEIVCTLRYTSHYYLAEGIHAESVREEFSQHAREEQEHALQIAARIKQLGGKPDFHPRELLNRSHSEFTEGETLVQLIEEDLIAERIAIESYQEMIRHFGEHDPTSRRLIEQILGKEEEHAEELASLLLTLDPERRPLDPTREPAA